MRALVVINPGNPTGQVLDRGRLEDIVRFCSKVGSWARAGLCTGFFNQSRWACASAARLVLWGRLATQGHRVACRVQLGSSSVRNEQGSEARLALPLCCAGRNGNCAALHALGQRARQPGSPRPATPTALSRWRRPVQRTAPARQLGAGCTLISADKCAWAACLLQEGLVLIADEVYQTNIYAEGKEFVSFKKASRAGWQGEKLSQRKVGSRRAVPRLPRSLDG